MPNPGSAIVRQRLLEAATDLFASSGYNGVSTRDIARAAEVNETSIYRHYPGKRELFLAALDAELSKVRLDTDQIAELATAPNAHAAMLALFHVMIDALAQRRALVRLVHFSVLEYNDDLDALYHRRVQHILRGASEYLARWPELEDSSSVDKQVAIIGFIAAFVALTDFYPILAGNRVPREQLEQAAAACADAWHAALITNQKDPVSHSVSSQYNSYQFTP